MREPLNSGMKKIILIVTIAMLTILLSALSFYCGRREAVQVRQRMEAR
jgi:hypothetical protein